MNIQTRKFFMAYPLQGGFTTAGSNTKTSFLHTEAHKTTQEFTASVAIKRGQLVKLDDLGTVSIWAAADGRFKCIGVAYNDAAIGEFITIWTRGYAIIWALSNAAVVCGPVTVSSYDAVTVVGGVSGYPKYAVAAADADTVGWALDDASGANELIRVLLTD